VAALERTSEPTVPCAELDAHAAAKAASPKPVATIAAGTPELFRLKVSSTAEQRKTPLGRGHLDSCFLNVRIPGFISGHT
jgi:hypothetical protein